MIYLILIITFLLDGFILSVIGPNSLLFPLCLLMSLIIIYPLFKKDEYNKYLFLCAFLGFLYDLVYTGIPLLNIGIFLLAGIILKVIFTLFSNNIISNILTGLLLIFIYRIISYLILVLSGYLNFSFLELLKGLYSSVVVNIIYIIVFYLASISISDKFRIQRFS